MKSEQFYTKVGGKDLIITPNKFAQHANGSCTVQYGDTVVLATVVLSEGIREGIDYFPLMVDYEEKLYAAGKIKGSRWIKREGKPSDEAILTARVIDRSLRPLFPKHILNDIQIIVEVLSVDGENDSDIPSIVAASCAVAISDIPFKETLGAVRIGRLDGKLVINPTFKVREKSDLDIILSSTKEKTVMLEAGTNEISEKDFLEAVKFGKKHITGIINLIEEIKKKVGKEKKNFPEEVHTELMERIRILASNKINEILYAGKTAKGTRKKMIKELEDWVVKEISGDVSSDKKEEIENIVKKLFKELVESIVRDKILKEEERIGGRKLDEIRHLEIKVGILPRTHGTGYFKRGDTEVLTVTTLGAPGDEQFLDEMEMEGRKRFMHHYNFPPFSVGEVKPLRGPSRRDIGHGALVERALERIIPEKEKFPYTIRLVSEVFSSNGSSSMASVCGSSLSLMDAGVPIKEAVAGIAMGLVSDKKGNYKILTDIQDLEDTEGGMDFKIAGTKNGITAVQMDTKTSGLTDEIVEKTLEQGRRARLEILQAMNKVISEPRKDLSAYAPRIISLKINPDRIGDIIGPGGKTINEIIDKTGVSIDIEGDGLVMICSTNKEALKKAVDKIKELTQEVKVGEIYQGKVKRILDFGAMVEIFPGQEGMVHISQFAPYRIKRVRDVVKIGDVIPVMVTEIDDLGRVNLSKHLAELKLVKKNSRKHRKK